MLWRPGDPSFALLFDAWQARFRSNAADHPHLAISAWSGATARRRRQLALPLTVTAVERGAGGVRRIVVEAPQAGKYAPGYVLSVQCLVGSYLAEFVQLPLPKAPGLSCDILLRAWHVLADMAEAGWSSLRRRNLARWDEVAGVALAFSRRQVTDALGRSLDCGRPVAERILDFLSWSPAAYKGLWGCPIVPVPGRDLVCLARPILDASNPIRRAEIWLQNGGLADEMSSRGRGSQYEAGLRARLRERIARNGLLDDAGCAEHAIKKVPGFDEEIDLLFHIGDTLVVGEVKCFLFPADSRERHNHLEKLAKAAGQAKRKAAAIAAAPDVAARALSITAERARRMLVVPIVVLNQTFGVSLKIDGCRFTDERFLALYLGSGSYAPHSAVGADGAMAIGSETLYTSQSEAERRFEPMLADPPTLRRFLRRLEWETFAFPTSTGQPLRVSKTRLAELSGAEKADGERLAAALKAGARKAPARGAEARP